MSVAAPGFPNYFSECSVLPESPIFSVLANKALLTVTGGPNSPIANGSLISGVETEIDYAFKCIVKMQTENISSMDPSEEAMLDFIEYRNVLMKEMVWSSTCRSWSVWLFFSDTKMVTVC
jgi:hypothetical protein